MKTNSMTPCSYKQLLKRCPNLAAFLLQVREISGPIIHMDIRDYAVSHFGDARNAEMLSHLRIDPDVASTMPSDCTAADCDGKHPDHATNRARAQRFWQEHLTHCLQAGSV